MRTLPKTLANNDKHNLSRGLAFKVSDPQAEVVCALLNYALKPSAN